MPYLSIDARQLKGEVRIPYSKSVAHRLMVCSFLAGHLLDIPCESDDVKATANCLSALRDHSHGPVILNCGESGTTLRFLKTITRALGIDCTFTVLGNLGNRPIEELDEVLDAHTVDGKLVSGDYEIRGDISSQYISGLLMALPLLDGNSRIVVTSSIKSRPYIEMTTKMMSLFGVKVSYDEDNNTFYVPGRQEYFMPSNPSKYLEGDWSNGAIWLVASCLREGLIKVNGLNGATFQGDSFILDVLEIEDGFDAEISVENCPDLAPAIALWAACRNGDTAITDTERLKLKESDRQLAIVFVLKQLGANIRLNRNTILISGTGGIKLRGTDQIINTWNDHRMVMMAAMASIISEQPVKIDNPIAVNKSYPGFFDEIARLGGTLEWN